MTHIRRAALAALAAGAAVAGLLSAVPARAGEPPAAANDIVVKLNSGHAIDEIAADFDVQVERALLASRGIYLVASTDPGIAGDAKKTEDLAHKIAGDHAVVAYAEVDRSVQLSDTQFHGWPWGRPHAVTRDRTAYLHQRLCIALHLRAAHRTALGAGATVAVLDTGADPDQPALAGRLGSGWNYVDDNADSADVATGLDDDGDGYADSAYGHGTFVTGMVALVAPQATILPYRVLDSDGYGSLYEVAQAILDATAAGADVINLSFGTKEAIKSHMLTDSINAAQHAGVLVVGAAGNDASNAPHYPAAQSGVLSTSALAVGGSALAAFSNWGPWADVAAPGQDVVGPLPGRRYGHWAGTSMAAPVVSGQAALLYSAQPGVRLDVLTQAITKSARHLARHDSVHFGSVDAARSLAWLAGKH